MKRRWKKLLLNEEKEEDEGDIRMHMYSWES